MTSATNASSTWNPPSTTASSAAPQRPAVDSPTSPDSLTGVLRTWQRRSGVGNLELTLFVLIDILILAFALVLCVATVAQQPDAARWGRRLMNLDRGAIQSGCLVLGSLAMAWALRAATRRTATSLRIALSLSALSALGFLVVLALDYDTKIYRGLVPGDAFRPQERYVAWRFGVKLPTATPSAGATATTLASPAAARPIDAVVGKRLFLGTCATCHGPNGEGLPGQGKDLRISEFVRDCDDEKLFKFVVAGRQPWDPANTTKVAMPGRGGNPTLKDADLRDIVAFLRELQKQAPTAAAGTTPGSSSGAAQPADTDKLAASTNAAAAAADAARSAAALEIELARSVIPPAQVGPSGLHARYSDALTRRRWQPPANAQAFFGAWFGATQIVGVHALLAGTAAVVLLISARRRLADPTLAAPVLLSGVLWWCTTTCWLMLVPLFYL